MSPAALFVCTGGRCLTSPSQRQALTNRTHFVKVVFSFKCADFYSFKEIHSGWLYINYQLDALIIIYSLNIILLYMFRASQCSSSGESVVSIHHLV